MTTPATQSNGGRSPANGGGREKRAHPRRNIALDVTFGPAGEVAGIKAATECRARGGPATPLGPDGLRCATTLQRTITVNISAGGVCLYTDTHYPVGASLYCALSIPGRALPLELVGTVAWFQPVSQTERGYKLGVEFARMTPQERAALERLVREPPATHASRAKRLLLVDDDPELVLALKVRFESAGFEVLTAAEGLEALAKSRDAHPHAIVLDAMLPRLSGYEVCRLLKFDPKFHHIPVIMFTARTRQEDREMGDAVGADAYLTKPASGTELLAAVDGLLTHTPAGAPCAGGLASPAGGPS
jgi:CheY-like chemotaxis protein